MNNIKCVLLSAYALLVFHIILINAVPGFQRKIDECRNQTNATEAEILNILAHRVPQTETEKCMLACIQKKIEFMGSDNKANLDKILKSIENIKKFNIVRYEKLKTIYENCAAAELTEPNECMAAFSFAQCVYPKLPKLETILPDNNDNKNYKIFMQDCRNKTGVTDDVQMNVTLHRLPKTKNEQCLLACMLKKNGQLTSDNKMNITRIIGPFEKMKKKAPERYNALIKIYETCKAAEKVEKDECVAAKNFAECVFPKDRINRLGHRMKIIVNECANETKASEIQVYDMLTHVIPKQNNEKCLFACLQKKMGNMRSDNTMDVERLKQKLRHLIHRDQRMYDKMVELLDDCKAREKKTDNACEAAANFVDCLYPKENDLRKKYFFSKHH